MQNITVLYQPQTWLNHTTPRQLTTTSGAESNTELMIEQAFVCSVVFYKPWLLQSYLLIK